MIEINDLAFSYGSQSVLENITMKFSEGKIYGLLGENGVGKTTLLTLLCGLKKCGRGSILRDGQTPYDRCPSFLQGQYYLPDEVMAVNDTATGWARSDGQFWPSFDMDKYHEVLGFFDIDPEKKLKAMSAGQLKKTYICFALACNTRYLFLDEPTNALDIPGKSQFRTALMKYTRDDATVIISTHQVRDLENIIDPVVILGHQDVLLNASMEEIASKLYFDYGSTALAGSLYSEQVPGGYVQVLPNATGEESKVNIEALFNAVRNNSVLIKDLFR